LDIQLNGAYNFDFSVYEGDEVYRQGLQMVAERIVETGVTSYVILGLGPLKIAILTK
jgi:N-acetylglucosamine-6-phosphate deacetylase